MDDKKLPKQPFFETNWFWSILVFFVFLVHVLTSKFEQQYHDASFYWWFAKSFVKDGNFSILNYDSPLRGYLYPLLNFPLAWLLQDGPEVSVKELFAIKITNAILAGAIFGFAGPKLWMTATGTFHLGWFRRLLFAASGILFWRGFFNFVLSDFPAILVLFLVIILSLKMRKSIGFVLVGVLVAALYNIRPVYILSMPFIILLCLNQQVKYNNTSFFSIRSLLIVFLFSSGLFLVGLPQYIINYKKFDTRSFLVLTNSPSYYVNGKPNLYLWQLNYGLQIQRYETNVGNDYPDQMVVFNDLAGRSMLSRDGISMLNSYGEYFAFVLRRPVDTIVLYARHLFNGLDILYTTPYIHKIHMKTYMTSFFNYTYIFAALLIIVLKRFELKSEHWLLLGALLLPCAACIPMTIECRFFLPLHLLLCAIATFAWPESWHWRKLARPQRFRLILAYTGFMFICYTLSASTQATLQLATKIIQP